MTYVTGQEGKTRVDLSQCINKNNYYHNLNPIQKLTRGKAYVIS